MERNEKKYRAPQLLIFAGRILLNVIFQNSNDNLKI